MICAWCGWNIFSLMDHTVPRLTQRIGQPGYKQHITGRVELHTTRELVATWRSDLNTWAFQKLLYTFPKQSTIFVTTLLVYSLFCTERSKPHTNNLIFAIEFFALPLLNFLLSDVHCLQSKWNMTSNKITVFMYLKPCGLVHAFQHFGGIAASTSRVEGSSAMLVLRVHGVASQKTQLLILSREGVMRD
jgi:hypothetical protein